MADARDLATDAVLASDGDGTFAQDLVERVRDLLTDPRDRALLTEIAYGVARRRPTLDHLIGRASRLPFERLDPAVRAALRVGLYQVLFLDRVPAFAAVDAAVEWTKARTSPRLSGYVNALLRGISRGVEGEAGGPEDPARDVPRPGGVPLRLREASFPDASLDLAGNLAVRWSHPRWLVARWLARYGPERTRAVLAAGCGRPPIVLRARRGRRDALVAALSRAGAVARAGEERDEVVVPEGEGAALAAVREGRAAVQDGTAQRVAPLVDPRPGERILDLCAAPGGKALHLVDLLGAAGEVVACDVDEGKVVALAALLATEDSAGGARGAPRAVALRVSAVGPLPFPPASFDAVLVDAPCSNTGVLRRRPEVRTRLRERDLEVLASSQRSLLERSLPLVRPGGRVVYATCSVEPEENADLVAAFAASHPGVAVETAFDVLPSGDHDGGFAAVLRLPRSSVPPAAGDPGPTGSP